MITIHAVQRRLAELTMKANRLGGYHNLSPLERKDFEHYLTLNASFIYKHDELQQLSEIAQQVGDTDWWCDLQSKIERLEACI